MDPGIVGLCFRVSREIFLDFFFHVSLARAFFSLPIQRQQILTMLYVDELSPEEIARILNCSVDYVYKTKSRSLNSLRKMLNNMTEKSCKRKSVQVYYILRFLSSLQRPTWSS